MKAVDFDNKEPIYSQINKKSEKICDINNVCYYNYLGVLVRYKIAHYVNSKKLIEVIKNLDFNNLIKVRSVLNRRHFNSKQEELKKSKELFLKKRKDLFDWLDKTKDPYFFLLNPVYEYNHGFNYNYFFSKNSGYLKLRNTGIDNLEISFDYLKYKIKQNGF